MSFTTSRTAALLALAALAVHAGGAGAADPGIALDLDEATRLAVRNQPLLQAQADAARAAHESAVARAQLPDPTLVGGLSDLAVTGDDRYSLRNEPDTQFMVALKQEFPGGDKRRLRGERGQREAERQDAELAEDTRMVRREAGLAWLDVWKAVQAQSIVRASEREAARQLDAVDIGYRSGRGQQSDLLAARVALELLADQRASLEQQEQHARNVLRRWIGDDADRPICPDLPAAAAPDAARLIAQLQDHPHVSAQLQAIAVAQADLALARQEYRPDWSIQVGYGYRPEFADFASVTFEVGLPFFTRNRQDRDVAARSAEADAAEQQKRDWLRRHEAEIRLNASDWQRLQGRIARYDEVILPEAARRQDAALAAYASGSGSLVSILDARRSLQDIRLQQLDLQLDLARHQVELHYFALSENLP